MPHPVDIYVGRRLKFVRCEQRISQERLAECVGITFQQIQKYEKATNGIRASRLYDLACCLGVPVESFFEDIERHYFCSPYPLKTD